MGRVLYFVSAVILGVAVWPLTARADDASPHPTVVMTAVFSGAPGAATHEAVAIQNLGDQVVDITDWCVYGKSGEPFVCFAGEDDAGLWGYQLDPGATALAVSAPFVQYNEDEYSPTVVFEVLNQSSGSIVGSNDVIQLVSADDEVVDEVSWASPWASGKMLVRQLDAAGLPWIFEDVAQLPAGNATQVALTPDDPCVDECDEDGGQGNDSPTLPSLRITEVLPNVSGSDVGNEYVEFWNGGALPVSLDGLSMIVGVATQKVINLPDNLTVQAGEYVAIYNDTLSYSLVNTTGQVQLVTRDGTLIDATAVYENPKDDQAWAWIEGAWVYTTVPTPGLPNTPTPEELAVAVTSKEPSYKPCAANQYRSPETNRCRKIQQPATLTPCKEGQYRSPETNRCRKTAVDEGPKPCEEGYERNVETNRCRKVREMTTADHEVLGVAAKTQPQQWYIIGAVGIIGVALLAYAAWEWRHPLRQLLLRARRLLTGGR